MAISNAMLAQAFYEYFEKNMKDFEKFLFELYDIDTADAYISFKEDRANRRLLMTFTRLSQDDKPVSERSYSIIIESPRSQNER